MRRRLPEVALVVVRIAAARAGIDDHGMHVRPSYDVVVVGGRVAGSLTSVLFARRGLSVLMLDRAAFPSDTLSTHFFRGGWLVRVLGLAGLLDDVTALGAPRLTREYSYGGGSAEATTGPPQDPGEAGFNLSVRREPLDSALQAGARRAGVEVLTSTAVTGLSTRDERVVGVVTANGRTVGAGLVVGADGRRSTVATGVSADDRERHEGRRALYYRYVRGFTGPDGGPPDGPEFSLLGDELAYVFPSDEGVTCLAISVNLAEYQQLRHDARDRFDALLRRHRGLWDRYSASTPHGRLHGSGPEPDYVRRAAGPGWALVGDSGMHQDPWTGAGMDCAGVSAELLVESYWAAGGSDAWVRTYDRRRDEQMLDGFHETVQGAADLSAVLA
jgi:menaquinone-9 beta-reductase